ncbi:MAG: site-2 protease family protein [Candidatus Pacearchaeota archaeon]
MKITLRIWVLAVFLALAAMLIINGNTLYRILAGALIILIPIGLRRAKSSFGKIAIFIIILAALFFVVQWSAEEGVLIKSVEKNSTAFKEGLRSGMIIIGINGESVKNVEDYSRIIEQSFPTQNETKITIKTTKEEFILLIDKAPEITVEEIRRTNIKTGLDLSGGARALVSAERPLSSDEMNDLISVTSNRLNVFGISDVTVRPVTDLQGNSFMLVEVAGASPADLKELIAKQGKFEAKIGNGTMSKNNSIISSSNETEELNESIEIRSTTNNASGVLVFSGGAGDISDVCRNRAECSGIVGCEQIQGGYACNFRFAIYLTEEAAKKHAEATKNIPLDETGKYLSEKLYLYVDDNEVDSLLIGADLKGRVTTEVSIQGSGQGATKEEAYNDAKANMNKLQTILITGSLPYKLNLVKLDTISPMLGKEFAKNILILALVVFGIICAILFVKYRKIKITSAVILTVFSEAILTLAVAAMIRWNLDAPSIAGIIAGMGTGINDQIILIDESVSKEATSIKERIKRALFIILGAFFTIVVAMLPLFWAGTGLLRGFALTTIIGVSVGILITRPAFADIMRQIHE